MTVRDLILDLIKLNPDTELMFTRTSPSVSPRWKGLTFFIPDAFWKEELKIENDNTVVVDVW